MIDFLLSIEEHKEEYDSRQAWKIRYPLSTILFLVFVCQLAGVETWKEMGVFIEMNESVLGEYVDLSVGCPSHDAVERVVSMVNPDLLKEQNMTNQSFYSFKNSPKAQKRLEKFFMRMACILVAIH